jgi:hypothetical protein
MNASLNLRLKAFKRSLAVLGLKENEPVWKNQAPEAFTDKHAEAEAMVAALEEAARQQEAGRGGVTEEKNRDEEELEDSAYALAQALMQWFADEKQEGHLGEVDLTRTEWRNLTNQRLLAKAKTVIDLTAAITGGPDAERAAKYGITVQAGGDLAAEYADYEHIVQAPGVAQAVRRALTKGFRPAFNLVEAKFKQLDGLILQFRRTEAGRAMMASWAEARIQKGTGHHSDPEKTATAVDAPPVP